MVKRLFGASLTCWTLALAGIALCAHPLALAQKNGTSTPQPGHPARPRLLSGRLPDKPSQPPAFKIAVETMGFSAPGPYYLGQLTSAVSLDFLDEDRLLFTFRVPGLIHRDAQERNAGERDERQIRAMVLKLPAGTIEAEALWTVHDQARYLWMLNDGHFLLRDRNNLEAGDASLELKPYLRFPGPLSWVEMDPTQQFLVTNSSEPVPHKSSDPPAPATQNPTDQNLSLGTPAAHSTSEQSLALGLDASASAAPDPPADVQKPASEPDLALRILRRDTGQVLLVSRTRTAVHLPINSDGYLESLRTRGKAWLLNLNYFSGGSTILGQVDSACSPLFEFLSQREVLVTGCTALGEDKLVAMTTDGRHLWEAQSAPTTVWPQVVRAPNGLRLARETLVLPYPVNARSPLDPEEVKGQVVDVLDAADGNLALETTASPALDAGGNVAISPSSRRVAVLHEGAIEVFELNAPPPLQQPAAQPPSR